jgi:hypothetical protein
MVGRRIFRLGLMGVGKYGLRVHCFCNAYSQSGINMDNICRECSDLFSVQAQNGRGAPLVGDLSGPRWMHVGCIPFWTSQSDRLALCFLCGVCGCTLCLPALECTDDLIVISDFRSGKPNKRNMMPILVQSTTTRLVTAPISAGMWGVAIRRPVPANRKVALASVPTPLKNSGSS